MGFPVPRFPLEGLVPVIPDPIGIRPEVGITAEDLRCGILLRGRGKRDDKNQERTSDESSHNQPPTLCALHCI